MIHESAADGYAQRSSTYAAARPSYHPQVLDRMVSKLRPGTTIDLGAGTGISTQALIDRGAEVVAVEPVAAMRERLAEALAGVTVLDGTASDLPATDNSVANVVVAQAFHWFDHGPALDELARVLEPGGLLATLWNVRDETVGWQQEWTRIVDRFQGETPRYRTMIWRTAIEQDQRFALIDEVRMSNPQPSNADHVVRRALSTSFIAALQVEDQRAIEAELRTAVADLGDTFDFPYDTEVQIWQTVS